jgi:putative flippase GtrA
VRYAGVSAIATSTSLFVLFVLVGVVGLPATWSNVVATAVGTVPSFELNRRWVWHGQDRRSLLGQVIPFTALSFSGLLVSTVAVGVVSAHTSDWSHWGHTLAVEFANIAAYGSLWVVQYVVLDRFLFRNGDRDRDRPMTARGTPTFTGRGQNAPSRVGPTDPMLMTGAPRPAVPDPRRDRPWMNAKTTSGSPSHR